MKNTNIQWHPGFVAAMNLELIQNKDDLVFLKEYNLNTKPLEVDLLVIRKNLAADISNEIGRLFRGHNIMEYKSPDDSLDIDVFYKTIAYACLYKSYGETLDARRSDDITVSLVRDRKPKALFQYFKNHGYSLSCPYSGIYYVDGSVLFPTQVVVTRELTPEAHTWIRALSRNIPEGDAQGLLDKASRLKGKLEQEMVDSILSVMLQANSQIAKNWKGDHNMYMPKTAKVLMDIWEIDRETLIQEGIQEGIQKGMTEGIQKGMAEGIQKGKIQGTVDILRDLKHEDSDIKATIIKKYGLSPEEARQYL